MTRTNPDEPNFSDRIGAQDGEPAGRDRRPAWLQPLLEYLRRDCPDELSSANCATLRPAAVLVVLIDSPDGPLLLLTERAHNLENYPGRLVFPGGAIEPGDAGPVSAALREAREEVGMNVDAIEIIGLLPRVALPASGFVVTAVVGWCAQLQFASPLNSAEVAAVVQLPLRDLAGGGNGLEFVVSNSATDSVLGTEPKLLGDMTAALIDLLASLLDAT